MRFQQKKEWRGYSFSVEKDRRKEERCLGGVSPNPPKKETTTPPPKPPPPPHPLPPNKTKTQTNKNQHQIRRSKKIRPGVFGTKESSTTAAKGKSVHGDWATNLKVDCRLARQLNTEDGNGDGGKGWNLPRKKEKRKGEEDAAVLDDFGGGGGGGLPSGRGKGFTHSNEGPVNSRKG